MRIPSEGLTHIVITCHLPLSAELQDGITLWGEERAGPSVPLKSLLTERGPGWGPDVKGAARGVPAPQGGRSPGMPVRE